VGLTAAGLRLTGALCGLSGSRSGFLSLVALSGRVSGSSGVVTNCLRGHWLIYLLSRFTFWLLRYNRLFCLNFPDGLDFLLRRPTHGEQCLPLSTGCLGFLGSSLEFWVQAK